MDLKNYNLSLFNDLSAYNQSIFNDLNNFEKSFNATSTQLSLRQDEQQNEITQLNSSLLSLQKSFNMTSTQQQNEIAQLNSSLLSLQKSMAAGYGQLLQFQENEVLNSYFDVTYKTAGTWVDIPTFALSLVPRSTNSTIFVEAFPAVLFQNQATGPCFSVVVGTRITGSQCSSSNPGVTAQAQSVTLGNFVLETIQPTFCKIHNTENRTLKFGLQLQLQLECNMTQGIFGVDSPSAFRAFEYGGIL